MEEPTACSVDLILAWKFLHLFYIVDFAAKSPSPPLLHSQPHVCGSEDSSPPWSLQMLLTRSNREHHHVSQSLKASWRRECWADWPARHIRNVRLQGTHSWAAPALSSCRWHFAEHLLCAGMTLEAAAPPCAANFQVEEMDHMVLVS
jgi:hypothetical protein